MVKPIGLFVLAGVLLVVSVGYLLVPFDVPGLFGDSLTQEIERSECSAPIRQVVDPPDTSIETGGRTLTIHDVEPACKGAGRTRPLTSLALLFAAGLAVWLGVVYRSRATELVPEPVTQG